MSATDTTDFEISGACDPQFAAVRDTLAENFAERGELGAAVAVYYEGEKVVDLWGGWMDPARTRPWREDTMCLMYSIAKSMCATCVHILSDRGQIDLDAPVADYWPEFAQAGKDGVLMRHIISHNCGVCFADATEPGDIYDPARMVAALEIQEPAWPAGSKGAYNTVNIGYLLGEVVRRVTGERVQDFLRANVCEPLGADYWIGVPESELGRIADLVPNADGNILAASLGNDGTNFARATRPFPKPFGTDTQNGREFRLAGVPSFGGFGEARAMARIYAMLAGGGEIDGVRVLSPEAVARARETQWESEADGMWARPMRYAMGYAQTAKGTVGMGPNPNNFGHAGSGGPRVLADPDRNLSMCYVANYQSELVATGVRTDAMVNAVYAGF
jgi:CubicO group peptidase (beta-lactamase class C family)